MSDALVTYLQDHLAGAAFAVDLLESLRGRYLDEPLGQFASDLLADIHHDRKVLQGIVDSVGKGSPGLKEAAAWVSEKMSRVKLSRSEKYGLGTFQALETLALGILGKLALWQALVILAENDERLRNVDLEQLVLRAQAQHAKAEEARLRLVNSVFLQR